MYKKIISDDVHFPKAIENTVSKEVRDLIIKLLNKNPEKRLGAKSSHQISNHPFFKDIDFKKVYKKQYKPKFKPDCKSADDTRFVDEEFLNINVNEKKFVQVPRLQNKKLLREFKNFEYTNSPVKEKINASLFSEDKQSQNHLINQIIKKNSSKKKRKVRSLPYNKFRENLL